MTSITAMKPMKLEFGLAKSKSWLLMKNVDKVNKIENVSYFTQQQKEKIVY